MKDLEKSHVVIAIGAGGVGKTTVASALGLYFAKRGQKTLVITVDPARRLLDAMGIRDTGDEPRRVDFSAVVGEEKSFGGLFVFMPNLRKEWSSFLEAAIAHTDVRHKISSNHFYQYMADGMPGAFEIICSHVLFRLLEEKRFDKIILDTPPSSHSISFFDVPQKISRVLEQGVFRALMSKRNSMLHKLTKKLAFLSGGILQNTFERIIGSHFLSELIDFALSIDGLYEPLLNRVRAMEKLLKSHTTKYALIVKPSSASIQDSVVVKSALAERGIRINQVIINQVMQGCDSQALEREISALSCDQSEQDKLKKLIDIYVREVELEKKLLARLKSEFSDVDFRLLFMTEALLSRSMLLRRLVDDLQKDLHESSWY